jgi:hypothetical protein
MWSCCYMGTGKQLGLCYLWLWIPVNIQSLSFIRYKPRCFGYSILLDAAIRVLDYLNIYFVLYRKAVQLPLPSYWHSCQLFFLKVLLNEFMMYAFHFIVMCNDCPGAEQHHYTHQGIHWFFTEWMGGVCMA